VSPAREVFCFSVKESCWVGPSTKYLASSHKFFMTAEVVWRYRSCKCHHPYNNNMLALNSLPAVEATTTVVEGLIALGLVLVLVFQNELSAVVVRHIWRCRRQGRQCQPQPQPQPPQRQQSESSKKTKVLIVHGHKDLLFYPPKGRVGSTKNGRKSRENDDSDKPSLTHSCSDESCSLCREGSDKSPLREAPDDLIKRLYLQYSQRTRSTPGAIDPRRLLEISARAQARSYRRSYLPGRRHIRFRQALPPSAVESQSVNYS